MQTVAGPASWFESPTFATFSYRTDSFDPIRNPGAPTLFPPRQKSFVIPRDTLVLTYYLLNNSADIMTAIHYLFYFSPSRSPMPPLHLLNFERGRAYLPHRSLNLSDLRPFSTLSVQQYSSRGGESKTEKQKISFKELGPSGT